MKTVVTFAVLASFYFSANADLGRRLCPDGYIYVGDDSRKATRDSSSQIELDRTQTYSCYKLVQGAKMDWISANLACNDEKSQLVSFETLEEMIRLQLGLNAILRPNLEILSLTSALHISDAHDGWMWIGSNTSIDTTRLNSIITNYSESNRCLVAQMNQSSFSLDSADCLDHRFDYICETRCQTVTYYQWFVTSYLSYTLIILLLTTAFCLCVVVSMWKFKEIKFGFKTPQPPISSGLPSYNECISGSQAQLSKLELGKNCGKQR